MVSSETGWSVRSGPDLAWPGYLPWLRARQMGGRGAENGARTALSFTWHPYSVDSKVDISTETLTLVEFRLEKTASGTLLLLTESGFDKIPSDRRLEAFRRNDGGWTEQMKNIESYVAQKVTAA